MERFLGQLLSGNYEVGIQVDRSCRDEICRIELALDKLAEQLRTYDRLRTDRVRVIRTLLDVLQEVVSEPIMVFDLDTQSMEYNSAFHLLFGLGRQEPSFAAVRVLDPNRRFVELLDKAVETRRPVHGEAVRLQMRAGENQKDLNLKMVPIRDGSGVVKRVLVIIEP
jgi:PAS domain-containing protein